MGTQITSRSRILHDLNSPIQYIWATTCDRNSRIRARPSSSSSILTSMTGYITILLNRLPYVSVYIFRILICDMFCAGKSKRPDS